jgi:hypothetical protein
MAKRKTPKRKRPRTSVRTPQPLGFDYGCLPYAMAVGAFEFVNHLTSATVDAVAYGGAWSDAVNQFVPTISLVGQHAEGLAKAFEDFNAWSNMTDPDSVEVTFAFRKSGGYVLAIAPEYSRLTRRCLGFNRVHRAIALGATWFKQIDSVNPTLLQFRKHCSAPVAPFLLHAGVYIGPRGVLTAASPPDVRPIPGLKPLLKFEVTFVDEETAKPNSIGWIALRIGTGALQKSPKEPPKPEPQDIASERLKALSCHFPVTLERVRRSSNARIFVREVVGQGVRTWQVEQAICNLVLSRDAGLGPRHKSNSDRKADKKILQALSDRYEVADNTNAPTFSLEEVVSQVLADGNVLLRNLGEKPKTALIDLQRALAAVSALDAPSAAADAAADRSA